MKNKYLLILLVVIFFSGLICLVIFDKTTPDYKISTTPKINIEHKLEELTVRKISFERNGLFLNGLRYNSSGISWYSKVNSKNGVVSLDEIEPPFILRKKENNDTLELIKDNQRLYIIVSEGRDGMTNQ